VTQMVKPHFLQRLGLGMVLVPTVILCGCSHGGTSAGLGEHLGATTDIAQLPAEIKATKTLLDASVLDNVSRPDPFQSLIIPEKSAASPAQGEKQVVENPLQGYELQGILYHGRDSMAILKLPGESSSKMVHSDEVIEGVSGLQVAVGQISKNSVVLKVINPPPDLPDAMCSTTLRLESLVGFHSKSGNSQTSDIASNQSPQTSGQPNDITGLVPNNSGAPGGLPIGSQNPKAGSK